MTLALFSTSLCRGSCGAGVSELNGVCRRPGLRLLEAALDVVERDPEHLLFDVGGD